LQWIPTGIFNGRGDEQITDINFAEFFFIDFSQNAPVCREIGRRLPGWFMGLSI